MYEMKERNFVIWRWTECTDNKNGNKKKKKINGKKEQTWKRKKKKNE